MTKCVTTKKHNKGQIESRLLNWSVIVAVLFESKNLQHLNTECDVLFKSTAIVAGGFKGF